ncbi:Retrovirus-related Pol polyprotein from transposon RE2 [Vitis vinifera]|uniref:Retrovirus-related Pol polyprotein from transposon RE2 n=1 Tax=Vitis vinifera TaxID=29760 RepID=A0A438D9Q1_VITVI|nr:Retrovirus-related Pol polyprotein from transposon RE2 [Vitis vinifera]
MGQGNEDHLVTQEADIPEAKGLYMNDIQRLYKVASSMVNVRQQDMDLSTYIGQIASLKEEFLTVMPLTTDVGDQRTQIDKFFMVLTLIGLRPDLETVRDQILGSSSVPSLDDVFARLLLVTEVEANVLIAPIAISLATLVIGVISYMGGLPALPTEYDDYLRYQATKSASVASVAQTGNASACLTHTSSLGPWILDSSASNHIWFWFHSSSPFLTSPFYPLCPCDRSTGKTIGIGHESQGLYHLTSPSTPAVCFTDAPLLIHSRLGHPSQSKFQKMVPSFSSLSSLACESCQLGKHTRVSFPKRLNNRAKSPFKLVHTDLNVRIDILLRQLALSFSIVMFFSFLGDAVLTACYLINRMPSSVLHDQIPHSLLFPDQPLYFLPPRVFGCTCFVHILTPGQDKLSARATKCIFLGYSDFKRVIVVIPLRLIATFSPLMSLSLRTHLPSRPLQVYHRRHRVAVPPSLAEVPADSLPIPSASPAPHCLLLLTYPLLFGKAMVDEMAALHSNGTWILLFYPLARLVAKGYTQVYGSDYGDTFSPVAKIASVRLLLSMAAMRSWPLYQLDIKNAFLHGDLAEEVYMEQPPGFVAQGESGLVCRLRRSLYGLKQSPRAWFSRFSSVVQEFGMFRSTADHSVFYHHNSSGQCIYLVVYVDDIVITGSDQNGIQKLKQHLFTHFQTKDLGKLKYFLGIEIAQSSSGVVLSQRKYALDIGRNRTGEPLGDPGRYRRLVGKLNYLTITRPDISFPVSVVSQFLQSPCDSHWDAVIRILRYIKSTPGQGVLYENRGHTQSKKQDVVVRSSAEAEYRAMALATCELIWLKHLLRELRFGKDEQMKLICDNQAALHIASNPVFHERTKHIEVDCHFIREKIASGCVATNFVNQMIN